MLPEYRHAKYSPVYRQRPVKMISSKRTPFQLPIPKKRNEFIKSGFKRGFPPVYIPQARRPLQPFLPRASQAYFEYKHPSLRDIVRRYTKKNIDLYDPEITNNFLSEYEAEKKKIRRKRFIGDDHTRKLGGRYRPLRPPGRYPKEDEVLVF